VFALIWAERRYDAELPKWARNVYFLAIGPGIALGYWAIMTYRRWLQYRRLGNSGANTSLPRDPVASPTPQTPEVTGGQRQRAGSA
jgi:hypothetical protein